MTPTAIPSLTALSPTNTSRPTLFLQKLVQNKVLDPETWTQDDDTALNNFCRGETAITSTNRAQYAVQDAKVKARLGEGGHELYRILTPIGTSDYQAENQRLECGIMISSNALKELGEDEFIKMMRFVDWLWYSDEGLTLTKWGKEGETYTVTDGTYSLTPGYYCKGLSIGQTSDDQVDLREELGYACGNFMYGGNTELLTSNFTEDLRDFYDRQGQYRKLRPAGSHRYLRRGSAGDAEPVGHPHDRYRQRLDLQVCHESGRHQQRLGYLRC